MCVFILYENCDANIRGLCFIFYFAQKTEQGALLSVTFLEIEMSEQMRTLSESNAMFFCSDRFGLIGIWCVEL